MKQILIKAFALGLLVAFSTLSYAQPNQEMRALVAQKNKEMIEISKAGNFEAMAKYYDANVISLPNYRVMEKGYQLLEKNSLGKFKGGYKIIDGQKNTTDLIMGANMMVDIGTYSLTVTFPGVAQPKTDVGKYMNVWKKGADETWKIVAETWNADKSPNAPAQAKQGQPSGTPATTIKVNPGTNTQTGNEPKPVMETKEGK
jgi:ketosteroid isomerase-like protein